jgi:hypothetical protein
LSFVFNILKALGKACFENSKQQKKTYAKTCKRAQAIFF